MLIILEAANEAADTMKVTKIKYKALFNHPQLKQYWRVLTQKGLLSYDLDTETFKTTQKDLRFLKAYNGRNDDEDEDVV